MSQIDPGVQRPFRPQPAVAPPITQPAPNDVATQQFRQMERSYQAPAGGEAQPSIAGPAMRAPGAAPVQPAPPIAKPSGFIGTLESDISAGFGSLFAGGQAAGRAVGGGIQTVRSYTQGPQLGTPAPGGEGPPSPATPKQIAQRSAFIAAGIVPGGDVVMLGERAATPFLASLGAKVGLGATYGGATSAFKQGPSPGAIAEGAIIGGATFGAFEGGGKVVSAIGAKVEASAAAGRLAEVSGEGASISQKFAMRVTGSQIEAPPVGGAGVEKAMGIGPKGEPLGISPGAKLTGKGFETTKPEETQPPRDISTFIQDIEGRKPTGGPLTEGAPRPPPSTGTITGPRSTPAPAVKSPYAGEPSLAFSEDGGGRNVSGFPSRELFSGEFRIKAIEEKAPSAGGGPAGPGFRGGGAGPSARGVYEEQTTIRYPPGTTFNPAERFRTTMAETPSTGQGARSLFAGVEIPGGFGVTSRPQLGFPKLETQPSVNRDIITTPTTTQEQQQQRIVIQEQTPVQTHTGGYPVPTPPVQEPQPTYVTVPKTTTGFPTFPSAVSPFEFPRTTTGFGFSQPFADIKQTAGKSDIFGFRKLKHPVAENLLALGLKSPARKGHRGKRKR